MGSAFATAITGMKWKNNLLFSTLKGLVVGFFFGIMGNIIMFPITILMGIANLFWFQKYRRTLT